MPPATVITTSFIVASLTQVYTQASFTPVVGLNTHAFTTPFVWDGTSNIIVEICATNATAGTVTVGAYTPSYLSTLQATGAASCTATTGTTATTKPIIQFIGTVSTSGPGTFTVATFPLIAPGFHCHVNTPGADEFIWPSKIIPAGRDGLSGGY